MGTLLSKPVPSKITLKEEALSEHIKFIVEKTGPRFNAYFCVRDKRRSPIITGVAPISAEELYKIILGKIAKYRSARGSENDQKLKSTQGTLFLLQKDKTFMERIDHARGFSLAFQLADSVEDDASMHALPPGR